ncbi:hypothetical protein NMY22_g7554 [Coprinellus aureogranulatus]|nr:hypothetical protein NMY22_g7554 [Coprinellus aureogranulatus]
MVKKLEAQFLSCLHDDDSEGRMLELFFESYSEFQDELKSLHPYLDSATKEEIEHFVTVVVTVSTNLVEATSSSIVDDFKSNLLDTMSLSLPRHASESPQPHRYIEDSLRWLRENLHDPYPSRSVRNNIAKKTNSSVKDVDSWFVDIRKRIGWSRLRQSRFGNRMGKVVDAAKRFFTGSEPHRPLESIIESEFASIAATVERLYTEKCANSTLAARLDDAVKDLTPELQKSLSREKRLACSEARTSRPPVELQAYPTPELSPTLSSQHLPTPEPPSFSTPPLSR